MDTKSLIAKLDEVAKSVDLDVSTILAEQIKDPVLGTVRSWIRKQISPNAKSPEIQQWKGFYDIVKNSTDFSLRLKDNCFVITNHRTNWTKRILELAFPYHFFSLALPRTLQ